MLPEAPGRLGWPSGRTSSATREVEPAADSLFRPSEELIVVFLVYNPAVTADKQFDLEVEYHFFRKSRAGPGDQQPGAPAGFRRCLESGISIERSPNVSMLRFWGRRSILKPGQPVMAGQGVPLAAFPEGEYRFLIGSRDLMSKRSLEREVAFTVRS